MAVMAVWTFRADGRTAAAGEIAGATQTRRPFRIGYVYPEAKEPMSPAWFRKLRRFLETAPETDELRKALADQPEGYSGFRLVAAEGFHDLVDRMRAPEPELDIVFCPAVAYCQAIKSAPGGGGADYTVIFQLQGPHDSGRPPRILRHGVVFVNSHHPLFRGPDPRSSETVPLEAIALHFRTEPVALVSRYSAPGYYYPCNALLKSSSRVLPTQPVFCGSSEEVVKMVLGDMVGMGACEEGVLDDIFSASGVTRPADRVYRKILPTGGSPTDPVVVRSSLSPQKRPELARLLRDALRLFFQKHRPGRYSLVPSNDEAFFDLQHVLGKIEAIAREE